MSAFTTRSRSFISSVNLLAQASDRLLAFVLIITLAGAFGATSAADLYFLAALGPLTIGFVIGEPLGRGFLTLLERRERSEAAAVAAAGFITSALAVAAATLLYLAVAYFLVERYSPTGTTSFRAWAAFAPAALALGLASYLGAVLLWLNRYSLAAARAPSATLFVTIFVLVAVLTTDGVVAAAAATSLGYLAGFAVLFVAVTRELGPGWLARATRRAVRDAWGVRRTIGAPVLGGLVGGQVIVLCERLLAATVAPGAVALLAYMRGVAGAPAFVSQAMGAGVYPGLVRATTTGAAAYVRQSFIVGLRLTLYLGALGAAFLAFFATEISFMLLQRGAFERSAVEPAGDVLLAFAPSTLATSLLFYLVAVLYGIGNFGGILYRSLAVFGIYVVLAPLLREVGGTPGLAAAFSLAQVAGTVLATSFILRRLGLRAWPFLREGILPIVPRLLLAVAALAAYRLLAYRVEPPVELRGTVRVGGAALWLMAVGGFLLLTAPLPEAERLRDLLRRALLLLPRRAP